MAEPEEPEPDSDAAVDAVLAEFNGNARAAIKALLYDLDVLARDYDAGASRGFLRHQKLHVVIGGRLEPR